MSDVIDNSNVLFLHVCWFNPYDDLNRLETASTAYATSGSGLGMYAESYAYDEQGRLKSMNGEITSYSYGMQSSTCTSGAETFAHAVIKAGSSTFCYDDNGNMETRTVQGATVDLTHDGENRLTAVEGAAPVALFADGFESEDLSAWDASVTDWTDLEVTDNAALVAAYGLKVKIDDTNAIYVQDDTPEGETFYRVSFWLDPHTLTMSTNDKFELLVASQDGGQDILQVRLRDYGTLFKVGLRWYQESGTWASSAGFSLTAEPHLLEILWVQGTGTNNGILELWLDGVNQLSQTDIDNEGLEIDSLRFGAVSGVDSGTAGTFYLDEFKATTQAAVEYAFIYDGEGNRIVGTDGKKETIYLGGYYEYETVDHTGEEMTVLEAGTVTGVTDVPKTVTLSHSFENPVVIAQPLSHVGAEASVVRLSGVRGTQFTVEIEEPGGGTHPNGETLSYMVIETGSWEIDLGGGASLRLEAGLVDTGATVGKNVTNVWESVSFGMAFSAAPAVFTQVQTEYDAGWLSTRQRNVATTGFDMGMEVHDAQTSAHAHEVLGWVAVEKDSGTVDSHIFEVDTTGINVTQNWYTVTFSETHGTTQWFVASLASYQGADGAHLRYQNLSASSVQVEVEEEDETGSHTSEEVHYFMLSTTSGGGTLEGTGTRTRVRKYYNGGAMREGEKSYFMLTDHLGSTSEVVQPEFDTAAISTTLVSRARYAPFGAQRYTSAGLPTAKTYTGQYEDSYIKLNWYGSRWYDPYLNHFTQPDSIVPNPYNPQDYNRYSYVGYNPIKYSDPSGHIRCGPENQHVVEGDCSNLDTEGILGLYGVTVDDAFTDNQISLIYRAVSDVGRAFGKVLEKTRDAAFKAVYKTMGFVKCVQGGSNCLHDGNQVEAGMVTLNNHKIGIATFSVISDLRSNNNIVHELGHAFDGIIGDAAEDRLDIWQNLHTDFVRLEGDRTIDYGFYDRTFLWSVALANEHFGSANEEIADMFLGWVYGKFNKGGPSGAGWSRELFMYRFMSGWVSQAASPLPKR